MSKLEKSLTPNNAEENNNSNSGEIKKLVEREQVEDTPFWIVGNKEIGYCLTLGKWKISEYMETMEAVLEYIEKENWKLILTLIGVVIEDMTSDEIRKEMKKRVHINQTELPLERVTIKDIKETMNEEADKEYKKNAL